ncbi:MAG TPA: hypothetical protein VF776_02835 [Sphingomicrobium sp.]
MRRRTEQYLYLESTEGTVVCAKAQTVEFQAGGDVRAQSRPPHPLRNPVASPVGWTSFAALTDPTVWSPKSNSC